MTLFSNDSTISEEVSLDYDENKVATYDYYCDDTYVIKSSDNYCHNFVYPFTEHYSLMWKQFLVFEFHLILPLF